MPGPYQALRECRIPVFFYGIRRWMWLPLQWEAASGGLLKAGEGLSSEKL